MGSIYVLGRQMLLPKMVHVMWCCLDIAEARCYVVTTGE